MNYQISEQQLGALLDYLAQRPWAEVEKAMFALQRLKPADEPEVTLQTLFECVESGQVDEAGMAKLLQDPLFRAYYERRKK